MTMGSRSGLFGRMKKAAKLSLTSHALSLSANLVDSVASTILSLANSLESQKIPSFGTFQRSNSHLSPTKTSPGPAHSSTQLRVRAKPRHSREFLPSSSFATWSEVSQAISGSLHRPQNDSRPLFGKLGRVSQSIRLLNLARGHGGLISSPIARSASHVASLSN